MKVLTNKEEQKLFESKLNVKLSFEESNIIAIILKDKIEAFKNYKSPNEEWNLKGKKLETKKLKSIVRKLNKEAKNSEAGKYFLNK